MLNGLILDLRKGPSPSGLITGDRYQSGQIHQECHIARPNALQPLLEGLGLGCLRSHAPGCNSWFCPLQLARHNMILRWHMWFRIDPKFLGRMGWPIGISQQLPSQKGDVAGAIFNQSIGLLGSSDITHGHGC